MGENSTERRNYVFTIDGKDYSECFSNGTPDVTESISGKSLLDTVQIVPTKVTFRLKTLPAMSRKRFVKLLMAVGVSRNRANEMAKIVVSRKESYRTGLFWCRFMAVIFNAESEPQKEVGNGNSR